MPVEIVWEPTQKEEELQMELEAARADTKALRKAVAEGCGFFMSKDGNKITVHVDSQLFQPSVVEYFHYDTFQGLEHQIYELGKEVRRLKGQNQYLKNKIREFAQATLQEDKIVYSEQSPEEVW